MTRKPVRGGIGSNQYQTKPGGNQPDRTSDNVRSMVAALSDLGVPPLPDGKEPTSGTLPVRSPQPVVPAEYNTEGQCTVNADYYAEHSGWTYTEGFALAPGSEVWTAHAWVVDDEGRVVDPTWADTGPGFTYVEAFDPFHRTDDYAELLPNEDRERLHDPNQAFDSCKTISARVVRRALAEGLPARWINLGSPPPYPDTVAAWDSVPPAFRVHYLAKIGDAYVDFTARQFDPMAPVPLITDRHGWREEYDVTYALDDMPDL